MPQRWTGRIVVLVILGAVVVFLVMNLNLQGWNPPLAKPAPQKAPVVPGTVRQPADFREYPIGEEVEKNQMRIAAVYLPPVQMDGMPGPAPSAMIHLEADIHAADGNRNGFAKDEFVPYLKVHYTITPREGTSQAGVPEPGAMMPMVARDGLHYGTSIAMPRAGRYTLTYRIEPPSAGGLGRHADAVTGVAPWWQPFEVSFDWDYPGPP